MNSARSQNPKFKPIMDLKKRCASCGDSDIFDKKRWINKLCDKCCGVHKDAVLCFPCVKDLLDRYGRQDCFSDSFPCHSRDFCPSCSKSRPVVLCQHCWCKMPTDGCNCINCYCFDLKNQRCDYCILIWAPVRLKEFTRDDCN